MEGIAKTAFAASNDELRPIMISVCVDVTPEGILEEGHRAELTAYKGVMISKANPEKDMFKINLLNMMQNK